MKVNVNLRVSCRCGDAFECIGDLDRVIRASRTLLSCQVPARVCGGGATVRMAMALLVLSAGMCALPTARAQENEVTHLKQTVQQLVDQVQGLQARVKELEAAREVHAAIASPQPTTEVSQPQPVDVTPPSVPAPPPRGETGTHEMGLPGGPKLNIRGFLDFNFDAGSAANSLIYPLTSPPSTVHSSFRFGEVDLFMSSKLSESLSFLSEVIFGSDATNNWGIDIERAQLTYKPSDYFHISAGRFHTSIGYYNNAFHHGTWFQTATGRPFMYFFEDSGGILPVHMVGVSIGGLVPGTGKWNLHWSAEMGNGESSVFLSDSRIGLAVCRLAETITMIFENPLVLPTLKTPLLGFTPSM